jgi:hypothetical protein
VASWQAKLQNKRLKGKDKNSKIQKDQGNPGIACIWASTMQTGKEEKNF